MLKTSGSSAFPGRAVLMFQSGSHTPCAAAGLETQLLCLPWSVGLARCENRVLPKVLLKEVRAIFGGTKDVMNFLKMNENIPSPDTLKQRQQDSWVWEEER